MPESDVKPTCFIAMPITTRHDEVAVYGGDQNHWAHVMGSFFEKAIRQAGFEPIRPRVIGANLIHGEIIRNLSTADLVLVDLSSHNPNVFFELGVRTSINKPIALVCDEHTALPFDISGINTFEYDSKLPLWENDRQQTDLAQHIEDSFRSCGGENPLWKQFGLSITASEPNAGESPLEAKVDVLVSQFMQMQDRLDRDWSSVLREEAKYVAAPTPGKYDGTPANKFSDAFHRRMIRRDPPSTLMSQIRRADAVSIYFAPPVVHDDVVFARDLAAQYGVEVDIHTAAKDFREATGRLEGVSYVDGADRPDRDL
ncbi:hypothetical protein [Promicromonospora sp. NPDC090134]|uniref:hypothetical protein n=1 Tax=Promicromonospora sp. NPDC090134 TaxID=3364408 RepID=UPI00381AADD8